MSAINYNRPRYMPILYRTMPTSTRVGTPRRRLAGVALPLFTALLLLVSATSGWAQVQRVLVLSALSIPVTENGGSATYTIQLNSRPTGNVTVAVESGDTDIATVEPSLLTFTTADAPEAVGGWNNPRTVTVTGINDSVDNTGGSRSVTITHTPAGGGYSAAKVVHVIVTDDDDMRGLIVTPDAVTVTESGNRPDSTIRNQGFYTVRLRTPPEGPVTVAVASADTSMATASPSSLTFTTSNWEAPQRVVVTGVDDAAGDPDDFRTVNVTNTASGRGYDGVGSDVTVRVEDTGRPDIVGVTFEPSSVTVDEGDTASYTMVLDTQPTGPVTVVFVRTPETADAVTVRPQSITFTRSNWNEPQTVTITSLDNLVDAADKAVTITHRFSGLGSDYHALMNVTVTVTVIDDDQKGLKISKQSLPVSETGTNSYTVALSSKPQANVSVSVTGHNQDIATVSAAALTFTSSNWDTPQRVTVTGVDDVVDNTGGSRSLTLTNTPSGADSGYDVQEGLAKEVAVTVSDDGDTAGLTISGFVTTLDDETDSNFTYMVALDTEPEAAVNLRVTSSNGDIVQIEPSNLSFEPNDYGPKDVVVSVADEEDNPGARRTVTITHTPSGGGYDAVPAVKRSITVTDSEDKEEGPKFRLSTQNLSVSEARGTDSEFGTPSSYTVQLDPQLTGTDPTVVVDVEALDAFVKITIDKDLLSAPTTTFSSFQDTLSLSFTADDQRMTIYVVGENDDVDNDGGGRSASITHEANNYVSKEVQVRVTDHGDTAGLTLSQRSVDVDENAETATYEVSLNSSPADGNVTVQVVSSEPSAAQVNASGGTPADSLVLTFSSGNMSKMVTVTGRDDEVANSGSSRAVFITHTATGNGGYDSLSAKSVAVKVKDDDTAKLKVSSTEVELTEGESARYTVRPETQPTIGETIRVTVTSGSTSVATVSPSALVFTGHNWETPQTVTISGVRGDGTTTITNAPSGGGYGSAQTARVAVTVSEDDSPGLRVTPPEVTATEGESAGYTVELKSQPESNVTVNVASANTSAVTVSPATLTFTSVNWSSPQRVTVSGVDDTVVSSERRVQITHTASSSDPNYGNASASVQVTVREDDAGMTLSKTSLTVAEASGSDTYTLRLSGRPTSNVTVTVESNDTSRAAARPAALIFTPSNWSAPQTVTVTGVNDNDDNAGGGRSAIIMNSPAGGGYDSVSPLSVAVTVTDDEGLEFSRTAVTVAEAGGTATYTTRLNTRPTSTITVALSNSNPRAATVSPGSLTFTTANWSTWQTVTVTGVDDSVDSGDSRSATITHTLSGGGYGGATPETVQVTVTDDEDASTLSISAGSVVEGTAGTTATLDFIVTKSGATSEVVTVAYADTRGGSATSGTDYTAIRSGTLTFGTGETSMTITVTVRGDADPEGDETIEVRLSAPTNAMIAAGHGTATGTISDDDLALLPLDDVTVIEGSFAPITLTLERALGALTLRYLAVDGSATQGVDYTMALPDGTPVPAQGTFTLPAGTQTGTVAVFAVDDPLAESDETFTVELWTAPTNGQGSKLGMARVTIEDNDELSASVTAPKAVVEGAAAVFTVKVGGATSTAQVRVSYSIGGTARAPADYTAPSPTTVVIPAGQETATFAIQTKTDRLLESDETLVVTLTDVRTDNGTARVGSPRSATARIEDPVAHSLNRVNQTLLPGVTRASAGGALDTVSARMAQAAQGYPMGATADLGGLTGFYQALQANERALQDGSYDLAKALGGSSFLVPFSSHDGAPGGGVGGAFWGRGDFRQIGGGASDDEDSVEWGGSVWSARLGADLRFVDSLLTGLAVSWTSGGLDYVDQLAPTDREGTYASWLISAHPYVGWTTPDFGLWATGGFGFGGVSIDDSDEDMEAQEADLTQWSLGAGASVTVLSTESLIAGGTTALKLKAEGFLAGASVAENEAKTIAQLDVGVNQARAAIEASHAQYFAGGGSLKPSLEIGGRFDGGDGETGAGIEVGGGVTYADPGSGLTVAAGGRALVIRDGNYGEWGLSGLIQLDANAAGHGLMMSVRPTWGVTVSGVNGLWEHGTFDLLAGGQPGGSVEAEIGYGLPAFGTVGVLTPYAGASLTEAGAYSLRVGGRLELGPAFDLTLEAERSDSADPNAAPEHDVTLEGSIRW